MKKALWNDSTDKKKPLKLKFRKMEIAQYGEA